MRVHDVHAVHPMDHRVSETSTALDWAPPTAASTGASMVTREEIAMAAKKRGLALDTKTFGPFFKVTARRLPGSGRAA